MLLLQHGYTLGKVNNILSIPFADCSQRSLLHELQFPAYWLPRLIACLIRKMNKTEFSAMKYSKWLGSWHEFHELTRMMCYMSSHTDQLMLSVTVEWTAWISWFLTQLAVNIAVNKIDIMFWHHKGLVIVTSSPIDCDVISRVWRERVRHRDDVWRSLFFSVIFGFVMSCKK